jgi:predicted aspartyl protease
MRSKSLFAPAAVLALILNPAPAAEFGTRIAMTEKAAATFYVSAQIDGFGDTELMVDTGSGYLTINEHTLEGLKRKGRARYVKQLQGVLANGAELSVPVYAISALNIGGNCRLQDVEAAVFPGNAREILGLSALRKAAPFIFSVDPPSLVLSHCGPADRASATASGVMLGFLSDH